jgi:hypothetical protein
VGVCVSLCVCESVTEYVCFCMSVCLSLCLCLCLHLCLCLCVHVALSLGRPQFTSRPPSFWYSLCVPTHPQSITKRPHAYTPPYFQQVPLVPSVLPPRPRCPQSPCFPHDAGSQGLQEQGVARSSRKCGPSGAQNKQAHTRAMASCISTIHTLRDPNTEFPN